MYVNLRAEGDPVSWTLPCDDPASLAGQLTGSAAAPVVLTVTSPLAGRLILAPRALSSLVISTGPLSTRGWMPTHRDVPVGHLYVPTAGGVSAEFTGYELSRGTELDTLERDIVAAIRDSGVVSVPITAGTVVLYGASLRLALLAPPTLQ